MTTISAYIGGNLKGLDILTFTDWIDSPDYELLDDNDDCELIIIDKKAVFKLQLKKADDSEVLIINKSPEEFRNVVVGINILEYTANSTRKDIVWTQYGDYTIKKYVPVEQREL